MSKSNNTPPVCSYEGSDYQTSFWEEGGRAYEDLAEAIVLRKFLPAGGKLMLELGAGAGRNTPRYHNFDKIILLDYSRTQLQQAQARLGSAGQYTYVAADIYRLPFKDGTFDHATMIRTLHHMSDAKLALGQVQRVLLPGAGFILEFANKLNLKAILRYILGKQTWSPFSWEPVEFVKLNFDFHPDFVRQLLRELGFVVRDIRTVSHFRIGILKRSLPANFLAWLDSLAQSTGNWWQLSPSVFVNTTKTGPAKAAAPFASELELFQCPACGGQKLLPGQGSVDCPQCNAKWAYADGIYDFREPI